MTLEGVPALEAAAPPAPKRAPAVAALLSIVVPGLGHIYGGRTRRGLAWFAGLIAIGLALHGMLRVRGPGFLLGLILVATHLSALRLLVAADAAWQVRRAPGPRPSLGATALAGLALFGVGLGYEFALRRWFLEAFKIPSGSMVPTLFPGDQVFVDKTRAPERGDVLVFPFPEHPDQEFIKRVIGVPGDRLTFRRGHPVINGREVPRASCVR